jgi:hypothetical protein
MAGIRERDKRAKFENLREKTRTTSVLCSQYVLSVVSVTACFKAQWPTLNRPVAWVARGPFRPSQIKEIIPQRTKSENRVFLLWNTTNVHFYTFLPERFPTFRLMYSAGQIAYG